MEKQTNSPTFHLLVNIHDIIVNGTNYRCFVNSSSHTCLHILVWLFQIWSLNTTHRDSHMCFHLFNHQNSSFRFRFNMQFTNREIQIQKHLRDAVQQFGFHLDTIYSHTYIYSNVGKYWQLSEWDAIWQGLCVFEFCLSIVHDSIDVLFCGESYLGNRLRNLSHYVCTDTKKIIWVGTESKFICILIAK